MLLVDKEPLVRKKLLQSIRSPHDLRSMELADLEDLADELRQTIIATVADTGGHLAPSLGVVELTLALHYVFDTPNDKLIWDVGHQAYAHKLLTGRQNRFHTLRQHGGLSGFPKRSESVFDTIETGHSSTSISFGVGVAAARHIQKRPGKVVAVIGDGSMTAGMAFEGLNHAGDLDEDLVVVLNDNEMSISENVGALSSFMSRKLTGRAIRRLRDHIEERLLALSTVGENVLNLLRKSEESMKAFFTPGMLFEAFKFKYVGPIPGHQLEDLIATLENVRDHNHGPVLVHVITTKGKGYLHAEQNPGMYHGVGPFDIASGKSKPAQATSPSYTKVFGETLCRIAREDARVVGITAAMPDGTGLAPFCTAFPDRFFDVGIAEQHGLTFAAGLALEGMRPCFAVYSSFMQRALDQLIHDVCLPNLPVTIALDRSGVVGADGPTHHGVFDLAYLRFIPNITVMMPKDENELQHMLYTALNMEGPAVLRYPRGQGEGIGLDSSLQALERGKGELLREGSDLLLLPAGNRVYPALHAAELLAEQGISAAVVNPRFLKPLDATLICSWASRTGAVLTVEDGTVLGGFGSAVAQLLQEQEVYIPVKMLGFGDAFVDQGPQALLWHQAGLDAAGIASAAEAFLEKCRLR
ncbi:MAG: 1-deoxy-D-xylulose-5-phosphate synthase [Desulfobulbaceae bacterium]|nr:1-deoxy-D-xylulose-5-phosphate synthase [Desulfobulbaceae bacterium]